MATTRSRPPGGRSSTSTTKPDIRRKETIEVDVSWLETEPADPQPRRPPPLADVALRHPTMEVDVAWLLPEPAPEGGVAGGAPLERTATPAGGRRRARPPWQPPTLPPPPDAMTRKPTRAHTAPIPREDTPADRTPRRRPRPR